MIDALLEFTGAIGPTIAGLLTVPILQGIKSANGYIDRAPALVKQLAAVVVAFGLTQLGALLDMALPTELALFDGDATEALIAAAIAFGVHAGQKARLAAPLIVLLAALAPAPAAAQVAVDSVEVQIYAPGDIAVTIAPRSFTGMVGDTVTFSAVAIDAPTGDTINALTVWSSPTPEAVSIDPVTGLATFLSRGRWRIRVEVERVGGMVFYELSSSGDFVIPVDQGAMGEWNLRPFTLFENRQLCVYLTDPWGTIIARGEDVCPLPLSSPAWAPTLKGLHESRYARAG